MKQTELKVRSIKLQSFKLLSISVSFVFICIVSGCITPHALDLAEEKSSPIVTYTEWNLKSVRSAVEQENGDILVFAELYESLKSNKSECYSIKLPNRSTLKETTDLKTLGFRGKEIIGHPDRNASDTYINEYLYPLVKAKKGCQELKYKKPPADSILPIIKLTVPGKDSDRIYTLLNELEANGSPKEKLYEIKFLRGEENSGGEMNETEVAKYSDVLLIYWPSKIDPEFVQPIGIAGGYESEDESTNLYYLLVPPAVVLDAIGLIIVAAAYRPM